MPEILLQNHPIRYIVRASARARHIRLKIDGKDGLQLIIPAGLQVADPEKILRDRATWILKHYRRFEALQETRTLDTGSKLWLLGESKTLHITRNFPATCAKDTPIMTSGYTIELRLSGTKKDNEQETIRRLLIEWYFSQAKTYIFPRVAALAALHAFTYKKVAIKEHKTRWGSCSSRGNLNFNVWLVMAPPPVIDYVIIHELCHLLELNHSPEFWHEVEKRCPDYRIHRTWLKLNGSQLRL